MVQLTCDSKFSYFLSRLPSQTRRLATKLDEKAADNQPKWKHVVKFYAIDGEHLTTKDTEGIKNSQGFFSSYLQQRPDFTCGDMVKLLERCGFFQDANDLKTSISVWEISCTSRTVTPVPIPTAKPDPTLKPVVCPCKAKNNDTQTVCNIDYGMVVGLINQSGEKVGEGRFGVVYKVNLFGHKHAAKWYHTNDFTEQQFQTIGNRTLWYINKLKHDNLVQMCCYVFHDQNRQFVVLFEYLPNHDVRFQLDKFARNASEMIHKFATKGRLQIAEDVADGLIYLHNLDSYPGGEHYVTIHRDVKCSNILLTENWRAKLCDFDLMEDASLGIGDTCTKAVKLRVGTDGYFPKNDSHITAKVDVYAFGRTLTELFTGLTIDDIVSHENHEQVLKPQLGLHDLSQKLFDAMYNVIIRPCLEQHYSNRPLMENVKERLSGFHGYFESPAAS